MSAQGRHLIDAWCGRFGDKHREILRREGLDISPRLAHDALDIVGRGLGHESHSRVPVIAVDNLGITVTKDMVTVRIRVFLGLAV